MDTSTKKGLHSQRTAPDFLLSRFVKSRDLGDNQRGWRYKTPSSVVARVSRVTGHLMAGDYWKKWSWMNREGEDKAEFLLAVNEECKASSLPPPGLKDRIFDSSGFSAEGIWFLRPWYPTEGVIWGGISFQENRCIETCKIHSRSRMAYPLTPSYISMTRLFFPFFFFFFFFQQF